MDHHKQKRKQQQRRRFHVRSSITGTAERPRLSVFRSSKHIYAQLIDDHKGITLACVGSLGKSVATDVAYGGNKKAATEIGKRLAAVAKEKGISKVAFDRGHYRYHGRVKALADGAREGGLQF